jgi:hypothetical protein
MGTLPYSLKCITEARVGFIRMQKVGHAHFLISKSSLLNEKPIGFSTSLAL